MIEEAHQPALVQFWPTSESEVFAERPLMLLKLSFGPFGDLLS